MNQDSSIGSTTGGPKIKYTWSSIVIIVALGISVLSIVSRIHFIETRPFAGRLDGQEPESHILVTDLAFEQTPWRIHHFLPIFTLGASYNKYINQHPGAASPDKFGNYYYCSTPPLTFVLPYIAIKLAGANPSIAALRWYNMVLQAAAALALAVLVFLCAKRKGVEFDFCLLASAAVVVIYMTAPECLKSHSINLWAQQFYAFLLIIQLILFIFYPSATMIFVLAFIGCLEDWTPYIANTSMAGIALFSYWKTRDARSPRLVFALLLASLLAGLCMIGWFATVIGFSHYFNDLTVRAENRSGSLLTKMELLFFYPNSFGLFSLVGLAVLFLRPWRKHQGVVKLEGVILPGVDPFLIAFLVMAIALVENILMSGHATAYSYDRLKAVEFFGLFIAWVLCHKRATSWIFGSCVVAGMFSIYFFCRTYETPQGWAYVSHSQQERLGEIIKTTASTNGPAFFNGDVRGAEVYYAQRNLVEIYGPSRNLFQLTNTELCVVAEKWCRQNHFTEATVYEIYGHYPIPKTNDFPRSIHIRRVYIDGKIEDLGCAEIPEKAGDYHMPSWLSRQPLDWSHIKVLDVLKLLLWQ